jgi:hypothetical protein
MCVSWLLELEVELRLYTSIEHLMLNFFEASLNWPLVVEEEVMDHAVAAKEHPELVV